MSIARLLICEWRGVERHDRFCESPSWSRVEAAVRALDGQRHNDLYLYPLAGDPATYLAVCGGSGRYLVRGSVAAERHRTAVDPERWSQGTCSLVAGGQAGDYPSHWIVGLRTALHAARVYWSCGGYSSSVRWEEDGSQDGRRDGRQVELARLTRGSGR